MSLVPKVIDIVISDPRHPVNESVIQWIERLPMDIQVTLHRSIDSLGCGDLLFLISCEDIVNREVRGRYARTFVIHASDLPRGRGWSPHVWQILEGESSITVTLLEAADEVDSGDIWDQITIKIEKHELYHEIHQKLFEAEVELLNRVVTDFDKLHAKPQSNKGVTYYRKRTPEDSQLDLNKTLKEQFDLIRICDPDRYPAFLVVNGKKFTVKLERIDEN